MKRLLLLALVFCTLPCLGATGNATVTDVSFSQTPSTNPFAITVKGEIQGCYRILSTSYDFTDNDLNIYIRLDDTSGPVILCPGNYNDWTTTVEVSGYRGDIPDNYLFVGSHSLHVYLDDDPVAHSEVFTFTDYYGDVILSPASGTYLSDQQIDFTIIFENLKKSLVTSQATLNGTDVSASLLRCLIRKNLKSSDSSSTVNKAYRCSLPGSYFQSGGNTLTITLQLEDGIEINKTVRWDILEVD